MSDDTLGPEALTRALQVIADADHARAPYCAWCGKRGTPYSYRGIRYDGLTAVRGNRLCSSCTEESINRDGVNIIIDPGHDRIPYVVNTTDDRVHLNCDFADGRDMRRGKA